MAKRNRRCRTFRMKAASLGLAVMIALVILPWIGYALIRMNTDQVAGQIRVLEREERALGETLRRQEAEWNRLRDPRRLDEAVAARGMRLAFAPPERTIRMSAGGRLQVSAAAARTLARLDVARGAGEGAVQASVGRGATGGTRRRR